MTLPRKLMPWVLARAFAPAAAAILLAGFTAGAEAQVTPEQQSAIRASCRSDFMAKCSGVTPGGREALQCLQKNVAGLSSACKTAVSATIPGPTPPAAVAPPAPAKPVQAAPAPATPPPAAAPALTPSPAAAAPGAPANAPPAVRQAPPRPAQLAKPTAAPKQAVVAPPPAPSPAPPPPPPAAAPVPAAATPPPAATRTPNAPVVMTAAIGRACLRDLALHCRHIKAGDGRKLACLTARGDRLSAMCKTVLKNTAPVR